MKFWMERGSFFESHYLIYATEKGGKNICSLCPKQFERYFPAMKLESIFPRVPIEIDIRFFNTPEGDTKKKGKK